MIKTISLSIVLSFLITLSLCCHVLAQPTSDPADGADETIESVILHNPLGEIKTPQILIGKIINAILGIVGSLALLMFVYGGLTWMLAAGNQEKVQKGKDTFIWAVIGLMVIFSAYALIEFIFTQMLGLNT